MLRRLLQKCVSTLLFLSASTIPCFGADEDAGKRFETYVGGDYVERSASLSTTTVWSVFGPVTEPGVRIKLDGFAGGYGDSNADVLSSKFVAANLGGFGALMAGYQFNRGPFWIKLYAGAAYQTEIQAFWQAGVLAQQQAWGGAAAIEIYWRASDRLWSSTNVSWLQIGNSWNLYSRAAYEFYRTDWGLRVSGGAEDSFFVADANIFKEGKALGLYNDYVRGGALLNLQYGVNDFTFSGGLSDASNEAVWRPYVTIRYGRKF